MPGSNWGTQDTNDTGDIITKANTIDALADDALTALAASPPDTTTAASKASSIKTEAQALLNLAQAMLNRH